MEIDMNFAVDAVLDGVEHLSQTFAIAERVTGERIDPMVFSAATVVAWTAAVHSSAPAEVAANVSEAAAEMTAILVNGVRARAQAEGEAFKSFGLD
jgi:hypothetical protein